MPNHATPPVPAAPRQRPAAAGVAGRWRLGAMALLAALLAAPHAANCAPKVTACIEPEPPPWAYWVRDRAGKPAGELTGISIELIRAAFDKLGMQVEFHGEYPWPRCVQMVASGQIDFAMDAYLDADRARTFSYSRPYRTLTPQVFFRKSSPVATTSLADLRQRKGCGQRGWSYQHYGLSSHELDLGVGLASMVRKLKAGRCDFFVEELETIYSARFNDMDLLADPGIARLPAPWAKAPQSHLMALKGSSASSLLPRLDAALTELIASGRAAAIWGRHAPGLQFSP